jgi:hypothetical protein
MHEEYIETSAPRILHVVLPPNDRTPLTLPPSTPRLDAERIDERFHNAFLSEEVLCPLNLSPMLIDPLLHIYGLPHVPCNLARTIIGFNSIEDAVYSISTAFDAFFRNELRKCLELRVRWLVILKSLSRTTFDHAYRISLVTVIDGSTVYIP